MAVMQFSSEMCREILRVRHFLSSMAQKSGFSDKSPLPDVLFIYKLLLCLRAEECALNNKHLYLFPNYPVLPYRVLLSLLNATHGRPLKELACVEILHQHSMYAYKAVKAASEWDLNTYRLLVLGGPRSQNKGDEPDFDGRPDRFNIMTASQSLQAYLSCSTGFSACYPLFDLEKVKKLYVDLVPNRATLGTCHKQYLKAYKTSLVILYSNDTDIRVGKPFSFWDPEQTLAEICCASAGPR